MGKNSSFINDGYPEPSYGAPFTFFQLVVLIFFSINLFMIVTIFKNDYFHSVARYILFTVMLHSDSFILLMSDILLILVLSQITIPLWLCVITCGMTTLYSLVTPLTLTVMTLERYVAICIPLRHGELCSTHRSVHCILIIHTLSLFPCVVDYSIFFASVEQNVYKQQQLCSQQTFIFHRWQGHLKSALHQFYFLVMCIVIAFCYFKILKVAKTAAGENKESTSKALRTVALHAFQLLLCLIQLWSPFIEDAVLRIDFTLFINVRFTNYLLFIITPRCLSSLIYGLRDDKFFHALKKTCFSFTYLKKL
ncbi:odorant receptor 131-2-like [Thalassophryne amazonica]|uniref:odorant receptor 131-2-like n=1 Tax=Thalassophryne amazonica TaxID=390379 RepID=UPI001471C636|nr:odorant receptor 131-2-like [Thalassophryne amazonica]